VLYLVRFREWLAGGNLNHIADGGAATVYAFSESSRLELARYEQTILCQCLIPLEPWAANQTKRVYGVHFSSQLTFGVQLHRALIIGDPGTVELVYCGWQKGSIVKGVTSSLCGLRWIAGLGLRSWSRS
jgi:hypothetical protein